jgi:hypothetical protein
VSAKLKIFVALASYRDPQLPVTIADMLAKAKYPGMFNFGICWQYDETEDINQYDQQPNFRVSKHHYSESQGLGWARDITFSLYNGEPLFLQLDSHHRFAQDWDQMMLEDYYQSKEMSKKPVLSTYLTPFENGQDPAQYEQLPCLMSQYEFSSDKLLMSRPYHIMDYKTRTKVIRARTVSGHFLFAAGRFIADVPYDPDIYFGGYTEETTMSVRAWTSGYDFFSPYRQYIWHEYTRHGRPKHWEDHGTESQTKKTSGERDVYARKKTRQLFGQESHGIDMGRHGLGSARTLREYEVFGGFDFKNCRIQDYTLQVKEPPNPEDYDNQFISHKRELTVHWDTEFFRALNFDKPKVLTLGILNESGSELYRKDFTAAVGVAELQLQVAAHTATFYSESEPRKILMYLLDEEKSWSPPYEKRI